MILYSFVSLKLDGEFFVYAATKIIRLEIFNIEDDFFRSEFFIETNGKDMLQFFLQSKRYYIRIR